MIVWASAVPNVSTKSDRTTPSGWYPSSSGMYISGYVIGRTMSTIGCAIERNGAIARSPASTSPTCVSIARITS